MVSGRSGQDEPTLGPAVESRVDGGDACSRGERSDVDRAWADTGIGVEPAAALRRKLAYARDIARVVDARQDVVGCGVERDFGTIGEQLQAFKCRIDREEPARVFRVISGVMFVEHT
jgi:hypothetical protein